MQSGSKPPNAVLQPAAQSSIFTFKVTASCVLLAIGQTESLQRSAVYFDAVATPMIAIHALPVAKPT